MDCHFEIPEISDERLVELVKRIRPILIKPSDDRFHYIEPVDPRGVSFLWDPTFTDELVDDLTLIATIPTLHSWGYYGIFKPSIAEVLAMIPHTIIDKMVAFETIGPDDATDLQHQHDVVNGGFHLAVTYCYGKKGEES